MVATDSRWRSFCLGVGLFLVVWGGKLVVVQHWGSDLPESDDWDAIGHDAIVPFAQGRFGFTTLVAAHNEHRVAVTRGLNLALTVVNGQWDARLECVVNGALHALVVVGAALLGGRVMSRFARIAWCGVLVLLTGPPVVWENIVRGFDSQHYLLIGFSLAAMIAWLSAAPGTRWWWAGVGCAVLALFTMGSGLVAGPVVVVVLLLTRSWRDVWRTQRGTVVAAVVVAALGWSLRVDIPGNDAFRARDLGEFWTAFYHHLQWPLVHHAWFGVLSFLPWLWLTVRAVRRNPAIGPAEQIGIAIGLWALVHYAAMAFMRGALQPWPPVRGLDNVVVGLGVNAYILLLAWSCGCSRTWRGWSGAVIGVVWMSALFYGAGSIIRENVELVLPERRARVQQSENSTGAYVATGDRAWLRPNEIPYPNARGLVRVLDRPEIRAVLPASVRPPRAIQGGEDPSSVFRPGAVDGLAVPPGVSVVGSATEAEGTATGEWRSAPIAPGEFGYWQFAVAARTGVGDDVTLELRSIGGQLLAPVWPPRQIPTLEWNLVVVRAPEIPAVLVARDHSADGWIAFSGPVEMATGSVFAWSLARRGWGFVSLGAIVVLFAGWRMVRAERERG